MEDAAAAALAAARGRWTQWEEVVVSNDRGRRLVHYYLRGEGDAKELAVVGRERSPRHMSYAVQGRFLRALAAAAGAVAVAPSPSRSPSAAGAGADGGAPRRWRSRREVVDWLSSLVSGCNYGYSSANRWNGNSYDDNDINCTQDVSSREISKDFTWLGSAWHCQQHLKHYKSFCRRGITISVHSFVYIMSEEMKRLIAYVEDLYEDTNSYNMVKVRWFDKADEVGVPLPMDVDDREIFFSLGRQDLNVECIDGLAAVLSAQHYEKFKSGTRYSLWQPYFCRRQIDDDEVKPFDVTQLQGYWSQGVLRTMFNATSSLKVRFKVPKFGPSSDGGLKRKRDAFNDDANPQKFLGSGASASSFLGDKYLYPGCQVEVLSQDSGIRGCWFRCSILKRHNDKIKVRYLELQDADETGNLEEWVMLTRVAKPDQLGIRFLGRPMVRPQHVGESKASCFNVGAIVDAWWHGGWWEGIVLRQGDSGHLQVYFPGEKRVAEFLEDELRHSLEWVGNKWNPLKERKDIANKLTSATGTGSEDLNRKQIPLDVNMSPKPEPQLEEGLRFDERRDEKSSVSKISRDNKRVFADLTNVLKLDNLRWRPRKRSRRSGSRRQSDTSSGSSSGDMGSSSPSGSSGQLNSVPDEEACKSSGEQCFMGVPVQVPNLVMSR
uniref:BAH domain-containing protein n=1 Tax=Setaria italica TaxID=4555 RepID=K3YGL1_SETIT